MKFDENDIRFSEFGFLLEEQLFTKKYIDTIYRAGLNLISIENNNLVDEVQTNANYTYFMNCIVKQNLIKSTFIFLFSNYEHELFRFLRKFNHSMGGELLSTNRDSLKKNVESIKSLLKPQIIDYTVELSDLESIRNILIHRNGKLLSNELWLKYKEIKYNNESIFSIDDINLNISVNENIIYYTHEIIGKFYDELINKALNSFTYKS